MVFCIWECTHVVQNLKGTKRESRKNVSTPSRPVFPRSHPIIFFFVFIHILNHTHIILYTIASCLSNYISIIYLLRPLLMISMLLLICYGQCCEDVYLEHTFCRYLLGSFLISLRALFKCRLLTCLMETAFFPHYFLPLFPYLNFLHATTWHIMHWFIDSLSPQPI